jgi:hypothetical protein
MHGLWKRWIVHHEMSSIAFLACQDTEVLSLACMFAANMHKEQTNKKQERQRRESEESLPRDGVEEPFRDLSHVTCMFLIHLPLFPLSFDVVMMVTVSFV